MHETLSSLMERAFQENPRPLEFYLREQSHLPGTRANLGLMNDLSNLMAAVVGKRPQDVRALLRYLVQDKESLKSNTPDEFVVLCGVVSFGACAAVYQKWRPEVFLLLGDFACSSSWRVREGAAIGFQRLLSSAPEETIAYLRVLASEGNYLQQRASIAALAEPPLLHTDAMKEAALDIQKTILQRFREIPLIERKREDVKVLRQATGYTISVIVAALPEQGFALMRECALWGDPDITWALRENLKKKRLAKFTEQAEYVSKFLA